MRTIGKILPLVVLVAFLVQGALLIHPFGQPNATMMDDYTFYNTQRQTGANSPVTSVTLDYRGYDTLGEATILSCAVYGVIVVLRKQKEEE